MTDFRQKLDGRDSAILVVVVPRDLSHSTVEALRDCVARGLPNREGAGAVLDMAEVELITSIGIAALLQIAEFCRDREAGFLLAAVPEPQMRFLRMLKLERKFRSVPSVQEAVAELDRASA